MTRILVTAVGGALAPLNIRLLKGGLRHPAWVLGVDEREDATGRYFCDRFETVPNGGSSSYPARIRSLIDTYEIDVVLPWSDEEALALAENREMLESGSTTLACANFETLKTMNDKAASYELLAAHGIRTPAYAVASNFEEFDAAIERLSVRGDGFAVKPCASRGNRGVILVRDDVEGQSRYSGSRELHMDHATFLEKYRTEYADEFPLIVSERLYPPAYDIDVLAKGGEVLRAMPRERLNPAGVPFTGGILRPTDELLELAKDITRVLDLDWLYDYDIMRSAEGEAVVLELNPRPSGSIAAAIMAGVPFYDDLISLLNGDPLPPVELPSNVTVVPYTDCHTVPLAELL